MSAEWWQAAHDRERTRADAAEAECARLREAMRRQSAAVRMHQSAREQMDAHDQATLRSLAGEDRAHLIEETAAARRERDDWNARATALESDRDAARAEADALRAIIAGRVTPPTDAEIAAHLAAGGDWLVRKTLDATLIPRTVRWHPLDATGCPTTWPVTP